MAQSRWFGNTLNMLIYLLSRLMAVVVPCFEGLGYYAVPTYECAELRVLSVIKCKRKLIRYYLNGDVMRVPFTNPESYDKLT